MDVLELVERHEGLKKQVYCDQCGVGLAKSAAGWRCRCFQLNRTPGNLTVGVGTRVDGPGITSQEARAIAVLHISEIEQQLDVQPFFHRLDQVRQAAVIDLAFNIGVEGALKFTDAIACLEKNDFDGAADAVLHSKWASQVPTRAADCAFMLRTGVFPFDQPQGAQA